ncbi:hypothetical protein C27AD_10361 [Salinisphaera hydrothermalis C27AD]
MLDSEVDMTEPQAPALTFICRLQVSLGEPVDFGVNALGRRRYVPITGGTVSGPYLSGRVLPGGGDWQTIRPDGVVDLRAQYAFELDCGTYVEMDNSGLRYAPPDVAAELAAGRAVSPSDYYFQTCARLNVAAGPYDWLTRTLFVAGAERHADQVDVELFALGLLSCDKREGQS